MNSRDATLRGLALISVSLMLLAGCAPAGQASSSGFVSVAESPTATAEPSRPELASLEAQLVFDHVVNGAVSLWMDDGTGPQGLFPQDANEQEKASWSSDGAALTFDRLLASGARIFRSDLSAPPAELATGCEAPECLEDGFSALSPDGTKLAFRRLFGSTEPTASSIVIADASGANATTTPKLPWSEGEYKSPRWSPDGAFIVLALEGHVDSDGAVAASTLFVLTVATGELRQLTPDGLSAASPDWSQSGLIVFGTDPDQADATTKDIYVIAPDGTGMRNVTAGSEVEGSATTPRWIPGTDRIVFAHITSGTTFHTSGTLSDIWVINADGTQAQQVTATGGQDSYPAVSPE